MIRLKHISLALSISFILLISALFYTQVLNRNRYHKLSQSNCIRLIPLEGARGTIYDRHGYVLAGNRLSFDIAIIPQEAPDLDFLLSALSPILDQPVLSLKKIYNQGYFAPFAPVIIARDVGKSKAIEVEEKKLNLPGVVVQAKPRRNYPYHSSAAHILGYLGQISQTELGRLSGYGYQINDWVGKTGIEKYADNFLRGEDGGIQLEVDNRGRMVKMLGEKQPQKGNDINLTIDIRIQNLADTLLGDKKGAIVIIDPRDGQILALSSAPKFDPNFFINSGNDYYLNQMLNHPDHPFLNRAAGSGLSGQYPPGSTFKVITAISGLESGKLKDKTAFECLGTYRLGGKDFNCWKKEGHGFLNLDQAIAQSCNIYFFKAGAIIGVEIIEKWARQFGLGRPTGIDLPFESKGLVPGKNWKRNVLKEAWYKGDTLNLAIGQGYLLVTPLQMAGLAAAVANGGYLVKPHLIEKIDNQQIPKTERKKIMMSSRTLEVLKQGMTQVIAQDYGTGHRARVKGVSLAGKTGTAETDSGISHAWFIGFAPLEKPKVSFCVFLEHGGRGGDKPADMVKQMIEYLKQIEYL